MIGPSSTTTNINLLNRIKEDSPLSDDEFIQLLAVLIYLRWVDFQEAELEAIAAFEDTPYEPVMPVSLHWRTWHQLPPDEIARVFSDRFSAALYQLRNSRYNPLATYLHRVAGSVQTISGLSVLVLDRLVSWLAEQPFETPSDRRKLLDAYDGLFEILQMQYLWDFKTPIHIAKLMVELAAPSVGESLYDPCFGGAGLLTTAVAYASHNTENKITEYGGAGLTISGIEQNESAYIVGLTRLALAGIDDPKLELGNSLERTPPVNPQLEGFDVVLTNPPWGGKVPFEYRDGLKHYPIVTNDSTGLFIQHALNNLRPSGRAVILVPEGVLFRGGAEKKLRQWLIEQHTIEAIVSLPKGTFLPYTGIKSSILVMRRGGTTKQIRMVQAEPFFEKGQGKQRIFISESQILEVAAKVCDAEISEHSWDVETKTLAENEYDLTPRRRNQSVLSEIFKKLPSSVELVRLKDCCQIMIGRTIRSTDLVDEPPKIQTNSAGQLTLFEELSEKDQNQSLFSAAEPIPYIRIKDINKGQATKGTSWISAEAAMDVEGRWKLRAGDILLSKSGTIGKVGIVRNGAVGAVAASGLYVLHADGTRLDPHFLAAYLDSSDCRTWLKDRSSGSVISHLTKRIIEELPVPLPPLQIQQRASIEWREHGVDLIVYLSQLLTDGERDHIAEWVEKELKTLPDDVEAIDDPLDLSLLDQLASRTRPLRNQSAHGGHSKSVLVPWLLSFNAAVTSLRGIQNIPHGPGLINVLLNSAITIKNSEEIIKGHLPNEGKARKLVTIIARWLERASMALLQKVHIVFTPEITTLNAGEVQALDLKVQNNSPLPLREITITLEPEWGHGSFNYLAENTSETIGLKVDVPKSAGAIMLMAHWSVLTLDGRRVDGKREVAFEVVAEGSTEEASLTEIGASPYVCGDPIRPERKDVFYGREELISQIRRQIVKSGNVVLLEGNRRAGKSSILRHLEGIGPVPGWLGVYCSLQGAEGIHEKTGVPTVAVFREIASSVAKGMVALGIEVPLPDGSVLPVGKKLGVAKTCRMGISEESPFADFRDYAEMVLDTIAEHNLGILLMLDEFDKLQEGIDNGVTSPQVPENIRYLVQTYQGFSAILTGSIRLKRLREEYWSALFGLGTRFGVTSLPSEAAMKLVTEPVKGRLTYSKESVERVIWLTNGQPYLLQCLCNRIFDMAAQLKIRSINLELVEQAGNILAENNEHFASLWDYTRLDRRRFILELIHKETAGTDPLRFGVLLDLLSSHGIEVTHETLISDLDNLRELELVEMKDETGSGHYALSIPLMGRWIHRQHDFEVLKNKAQMETEDSIG